MCFLRFSHLKKFNTFCNFVFILTKQHADSTFLQKKNVNEPFIKNMYEPSVSLTCHIAGRLFVLSLVSVSAFQTKLESETQKLVGQHFGIPLTYLTLSHFCACQKPKPGFPLTYVMVCSII
jgi:hypothetical protein